MLTPKLFPSSIFGIINWIHNLIIATWKRKNKFFFRLFQWFLFVFLHCRENGKYKVWFYLRDPIKVNLTSQFHGMTNLSHHIYVFCSNWHRCYLYPKFDDDPKSWSRWSMLKTTYSSSVQLSLMTIDSFRRQLFLVNYSLSNVLRQSKRRKKKEVFIFHLVDFLLLLLLFCWIDP